MGRAAGWIAGAAVCAGLAAACGGGDDDAPGANASRFQGERAAVAQVVDDFQRAAREGDGERICDELFTRNLAISVQRASGRSCAEEVTSNVGEDTTFEVVAVQLRRRSAVAQVLDERRRRSSLVFLREGGGWRIGRIGRLTS